MAERYAPAAGKTNEIRRKSTLIAFHNPSLTAGLVSSPTMMVGVAALPLMPETVVDERPLWTLAVNRNQNLLGKTMLVLNRPCSAVLEVESTEWSALHDELRRLVPALTALFSPDQFNFAFLMNQDAQVHLHVIPRYASPRIWSGRRFEDSHWGGAFGHEQEFMAGQDLARLAADIRDQLNTAT